MTDVQVRRSADAVGRPRFAAPSEHARVAVVVVGYNSADHLPALFAGLRTEARTMTLRVVLVDNDSSDDTIAVSRAEGDVVVVAAGGNLGYAGAINASRPAIGGADAVLVLNPDLEVEAGCLAALLRRLERPGVAAAVPRILDADGSVYPSLRREPTILRALGDAAFGSRLPGRSGRLSEMVFAPSAYSTPAEVEWATGAAIMVGSATFASIDWDERFFLYSEETDFLRRVRQQVGQVWFEPTATVRHSQGGSGSSAQLDALRAVNRVRYARKHHGRAWSGAYRAAAVLHEVARSSRPDHRFALAALVRPALCTSLPRARRSAGVLSGSAVIIPAHNEEAVIRRTLASVSPLTELGVELIVACNACTDRTAEIARAVPGVTVIEISEASKTAAMNAADRIATGWPRLYLDADIEITAEAVSAVFGALSGDVEGARPSSRYETTSASLPVRRYYAARSRLLGTWNALWGAGAYALSESGRRRLGDFPALVADDLWVDAAIPVERKRIVETTPVIVRTPRTVGALLTILQRTYRGNAQVTGGESSRSTVRSLLRTVRGPVSATDAAIYACFAVAGRRRARGAGSGTQPWERDDSSRQEVTPVTTDLDLVVLTRFNLPSAGAESTIRAREGWLRGRVALFERYCLPSMRGQTANDATWIIYFDPESPAWLRDWIAPLQAAGVFRPVYRETVSPDDLVADLREAVPRPGDGLITINLDNDDALAVDALTRLREVGPRRSSTAVYLQNGLIATDRAVYRRHDAHNAFCAVIEPWAAPRTCWADWHTRLPLSMSVIGLGGAPAWLQMVHATNVSNRVRGRLTTPAPYLHLFPGALEAIDAPARRELVIARVVREPARAIREVVRGVVKSTALAVVGKDGLTRVKGRLARAGRTS